MALGLPPRCVGNQHQRLVFDDFGLPEFGVAEADVSSEYHWSLKRPVSWRMSNEYLRRYLWLLGAQFAERRCPLPRSAQGIPNASSKKRIVPFGFSKVGSRRRSSLFFA